MKQTLKINNHLDKHLNQLKSEKGEKSSLELATEGNGARISGDLEVTGYTDNIKLRGEAIVKADGNVTLDSAGDIKLDSAGDITLDADGLDIKFGVAGTNYLNWHVTNGLTMYFAGDLDDSFNIVLDSNGRTTMTTVDDSGSSADLLLAPDGDVALKPDTGVVRLDATDKLGFDQQGTPGTYITESSDDVLDIYVGDDKMLTLDEATDKITMAATNWVAGTVSGATITEFSAANSAYAGMILGYTALSIDSADASYTTTTSMAVPHSTLQVTFVAPPSRNVEISVSVFVDTVAGRNLIFGLSDNSTYSPIDFPNANDETNEHYVYKGDETDEEDVTHQWVVQGLTPGASYTWYFGAKAAITEGAYVLKWGGNAVGEYAPFIMKATALPETIYTG